MAVRYYKWFDPDRQVYLRVIEIDGRPLLQLQDNGRWKNAESRYGTWHQSLLRELYRLALGHSRKEKPHDL